MQNFLKLTFILTVFTFPHLNTFGQNQFGVKASGGLSKITNSDEFVNITHSTPFVPSGQFGFFYSHPLHEKSSLGAELLFSQIEGKDIIDFDLDDLGENTTHVTNVTFRHISYLSLPVYYGFNSKKLTINVGFQISRALIKNGREKMM